MQYIVGIDVGTSGCKVAILDENYQIKTVSQQGYKLTTPRPSWIEFDTVKIWDALCESVREALARLDVRLTEHSYCVALSVYGEGLIITDEKGRPIHPGILSSDVRSAAIADRMEREIGRRALFDKTGRTPHSMAVATKIIWAKENLADLVKPTTCYLDVHSWLLARLGLGMVTDHSVASGAMLLDIEKKAWDPELVAYAGIGMSSLPDSLQAGTYIGSPTSEAAQALGFPDARNVHWVVGAMDQQCNMVGGGAVMPGDSICSAGTVESVGVVLDPAARSEALMNFNMPKAPSAMPDQYVTLTFVWNGGGSLRWFCDQLAKKEKDEAAKSGSDVYTEVLRQEPQARNIFFLPHLSGSAMPWMNASSRAAFLGLTLAADVVSMAHAVIEGVTFALKENVDNLESTGTILHTLNVVGGGSKSDKWMPLKADILRKTVSRLAMGEAGCMGAAILAGYGCKLFDNPIAAAKRIVKTTDVFQPSVQADYYQRKYQIYRRVYPTLESINREISAFDA